MSIINFNMLKIDNANKPKIIEDKMLETILGKIPKNIVSIINSTHKTSTNDNL